MPRLNCALASAGLAPAAFSSSAIALSGWPDSWYVRASSVEMSVESGRSSSPFWKAVSAAA
jgi:hypothetical protein